MNVLNVRRRAARPQHPRPPQPSADGPVPAPETPGGALSAVPSTLRIPLAARALGDAMFPAVAVRDAHAARMLAALRDDGSRWVRDRASMYGVLVRTRRFRQLARDFLAHHPDGRAVNLGCGLSHYAQWMDDGPARWTDADLPEVLALRRRLLPAPAGRRDERPVDLRDAGWWEALGLPADRAGAPVFLFAEGVLMYLRPEEAARVLRTFGERAPAGSALVFDALCWLAAGRAERHALVRQTGAQFHWGPRRRADLTAPHPRLRLESTYPVMEGYGLPYALLGPWFRQLTGIPLYAIYLLRAAP
ncbi:MAG: class I SAM-dependent methyltransferase [Xylophilus ampelinus]